MPENAFEFFQGTMNRRRVTLLERNHDISKFVLGVLDECIDYANSRGVNFEDIRLEDPHIVNNAGDQVIRARVSHL